MINPPSDSISKFQHQPFNVADWRIDPPSNCVIQGDKVVRLEPKAMQVLVHLASRANRVVTREELEEEVWTGLIVGPDALTNAVIKVRRAFGDDARSARFIETIPKTGYRLIAPVSTTDGEDAQPPLEHKLCAILYADVAGYSRLTGENEELTHRVLSSHLDLFTATIRSHNGSVVHYAGDAVLAEFATVTEALSCAAEVQRELRAGDGARADEPCVQFRIGINLGEVIVDRDDIYGDGVNVAARLEGLADPGGICISEAVKLAVGNKLPLDYEFMGEQSVKNITEPVRAYRVLFYPAIRRTARSSKRFKTIGLLAAGLLLIGSSTLYYAYNSPLSPTAKTEKSKNITPISGKPAIAVLPFANVSVDPEEEYFSDGMTDDIITDLSKVSGLDVIARSTVFTYKNQVINVADIGRELGVQYILEGSIRKVADRVRINIQLVDAATGRHLWAERYDRDYEGFFALQDEVIARIVSAVSVSLTDTEALRIERPPTASLEAYDYYLRAEQVGYIGGTSRLSDTMSLYTRAISLDPNFADAHAGLARTAVAVWRQDISELMPGAQAREYAYKSAARALEIDPANQRAYSVLAILQLVEGHHEAAIESARKAVAIGPGHAQAYLDLGLVLAYAGESNQGVAAIETALRLNPKPTPNTRLYAGVVLFIDGQYERAIDTFKKARTASENSTPVWNYLAAAHALLGHIEESRNALKGLLDSLPSASIEYYRILYAYFRRDEDLEKLLNGLRMAGVPDWPFGFQRADTDLIVDKELRALVLGRTWVGKHANGTTFVQEISASGSLAYRSKNSFQSGSASIRGETLCQRFDGTTVNKELCGYVYRNAGGSADTQDEYIVVMPDSLRYFSALP